MVVSGRGPYLGRFNFCSTGSLFLGLADVGHAVAHPSAEHVHACGVCNEIHAGAFVKSHGFPCRKRVLIRREELEVPLVRGLLVFDTILHVLRRVFAAGVLHAVGDDDAKDVLGTLRLFLVCELVANGVDGDANGVVESRAAGTVIPCHEVVAELREISGFDRPLDLIVELEEVEDSFAGFFTLFFGGTWKDTLYSVPIALMLRFVKVELSHFNDNKMVDNIILSAILTFWALIGQYLFPSLHSDLIIIGDIMLLIPGLAFCNSIHDMVKLIQILSAGVAGIGFAMIFHIRPKHLPASFFGAALGWFLYLLTKQVWNSNAIGMMFAALGVTVYSEIGARVLRMPVSVIYSPAIIPLIPGGHLYYCMRGFVTDSHADFVKYGSMLLEDTLSIVLGTMVVLTFVSAFMQKRKRKAENE